MKSERTKGFVSGMLVMVILVGLIGTATAAAGQAQINVGYKNIRINLDGYPQDMKDANGNTIEPFSYNGTIYVPIRGISKMFGCDVEWKDNGDSGLVSVKSPARASNEYYQDTGVPRFDGANYKNTFYDIYLEDEKNIQYIYKMSYDLTAKEKDVDFAYDVAASVYKTLMNAYGFSLIKEDTFSDRPRYTFKNSTTNVTVVFFSMKIDGEIFVNVLVNTSNMKASTPSSKNTTSGEKSSTPNSGDENRKKYETEKAALDAKYNEDRTALEADFNAAVEELGIATQASNSVMIKYAQQKYDSAKNALDRRDEKYQSDLAALQSKYGV